MRTHLADALRWSAGVEVGGVRMLTAALGLAVPMAVAIAAGRPEWGFIAAAGSLTGGGEASGRVPDALAGLAAGLSGWTAAALVGGHGAWTPVLVLLLAAVAAVAGGYSRALAVAGTRFTLSLVIAGAIAATAGPHWTLVAPLTAGGLWTVALGQSLSAGARALGWHRPATAGDTPHHTARQMLARWRRALRTAAGWQYPARLTAGLAAALALAAWWPSHHGQWIALTVVLLTARDLTASPVRAVQRVLGTLLGVLAAGLLMIWSPPGWALAVAMGGLGGVRPLLSARSYLLYSAVMTPLVVMMLDAGRPAHLGVLGERLAATLIGAALVLAGATIARRLVPKPAVRDQQP